MKALLALMVAVVVCAAVSATAEARPTGYWVSEYAMSARLKAKYDYAFCSGQRRFGTHALNTRQWGWVPGYWRFDCAYSTQYRSCFGGQFESDAGAKRGSWYPRMLSPGRCYAK